MNIFSRFKAKETPFATPPATHGKRSGASAGFGVTLPNPVVPSFGARLSGIFGGIYNYFTDTGESYDAFKTLVLARNYALADPIVASYIRVMQNNVVGHTGFNLQCKINVGADPLKNSDIKVSLENEFYKFLKDPNNFDISGRQNNTEFMRSALRNFLIEGEIVIRIYKNGPYGYQFQLLNFDSIDYEYSSPKIFNGVEIDQFTKPVAFWIKDAYLKRVRVPANEIIHVINYFDPAQYRGISTLSSILSILKDINTYRKTEINAAMAEATNVLTYESTPEFGRAYEGAQGTAGDVAMFKPGMPGMEAGADTLSASKAVLEAYQASTIRVGTTAIEALPAGVSLKQIGSVHPNKSVSEFQKSIYKLLGAGLGISYLTLMMDLDASSYSGGRQTALLERPTFKFFREMLTEKIMERIFTLVMPGIIKKLELPMIEGVYDVYLDDHQFHAHGFDYINPKDEMAANIQGINSGLMSYTQVLGENSVDLEDHLKTLQSERALMAQYGLSLASVSNLNTDTLAPATGGAPAPGQPGTPVPDAGGEPPVPENKPAPAPAPSNEAK